MRRSRSIVRGVGAAVALAGLLAACGSSSTKHEGASSTTQEGGSSAGPDVTTAFNKALGAKILVDSRGLTLYEFDADAKNTPTCYDDATFHCSKGWLPLLADGAVKADDGVDTSLLTTVKRIDGTVQVSYNRHPLYTFAGFASGGNAPAASGDKEPGDANGQAYVGSWWVLSPAGKLIKKTPSG